VLRGIYALTQAELDWYYQYGVSEMHPEKFEKFQAPIPEAERSNMMLAYHQRLTGDNAAEKIACAKAWSQWEGGTVTLRPDADLV
ncbi:hypothetical protein Q4595_28765, partial [Wenyingzhuangia sp. 1_MG-2023]|nr:hypothetical protein [Wenyingzhuangia sp. 1_MG-2023]